MEWLLQDGQPLLHLSAGSKSLRSKHRLQMGVERDSTTCEAGRAARSSLKGLFGTATASGSGSRARTQAGRFSTLA